MGTQQQLTTQQTELLIIIKEIEDFDKEQPGNIPLGGIGEIIVSNSIMTHEELAKTSKVLESYGYLHGDYKLTLDGRQYVELFEEYLKEKAEIAKEAEKSKVEHVSFSLINIEKLEAALAKIDILGISFKFLELFKRKR